MICGFCGRELPEQPPAAQERCGACPGGCRKVHCPHCGYANPAVGGFLKRFSGRTRGKPVQGADDEPVP